MASVDAAGQTSVANVLSAPAGLDHTGGIKARYRLMWIAAGIAEDARPAYLEVSDPMRVPEDPERDPVGAHEIGHIAGERTRERAQLRHGRPRPDQRRMVSHDDGRTVVGLRESLRKPSATGEMKHPRVARGERTGLRAELDLLVVVDDPLAQPHRLGAPLRTVKVEIAPERTTQKASPAEDHLVVLEHAHRRPNGRAAQLIDQLGHRVSVELVVARDVEHRAVARPPASPVHAARPGSDVARQDDSISVDTTRHEPPTFEVQVTKYVQAHALHDDRRFWPFGRTVVSPGVISLKFARPRGMPIIVVSAGEARRRGLATQVSL